MSLILPPFDPAKRIRRFPYDRANGGLKSSLVGIVDNYKETRLEILYGLKDQYIAEDLAIIALFYDGKFIHPGKVFDRIGDVVLGLKNPSVYRKENLCSLKGYRIEGKSLNRVIEAVREGKFAKASLQNRISQFDASGNFLFYNEAHVVLKK